VARAVHEHPSPRHPRRLLFAVFLLLSCTLVPMAHAGGQKDDPLIKVDELIAERRYNDAVIALTAIIKKDPTRFDAAQKRLQRIIKMREEYNAVAGKLLDVMVNYPTDDERKLDLISELESLEKAPNPASREFLSKTKATALFTYNRARFDAIMAQGRQKMNAKDYAGAAATYSQGFVLYKEEFDQAGYNALVVSRVEDTLDVVKNAVDRFPSLIDRLNAAKTTFVADFSAATSAAAEGNAPDTAHFLSLLDEAENAALAIASLRNMVASGGHGFETQFLLLQTADKSLTDSSFLPFAFRFILGRKTEVQPEGILGAMDSYWIGAVNDIQSAATKAADAVWLAATEQKGAPAFLAAAEFADIACSALGLWSTVALPEASPTLTTFGKTIIAGKPTLFEQYRMMQKAATALAFHSKDAESVASHARGVEALLASSGDRQEIQRSLASNRSYYQGLEGSVGDALSSIGDIMVEQDRLLSLTVGAPEANSYLAMAKKAYEELSTWVRDVDIDAALGSFRMDFDIETSRYQALLADYQRGMTLISGVPSWDAPGAKETTTSLSNTPPGTSSGGAASSKDIATVLYRYPAQSIPVFTSTEKSAGEVAASVGSLLARVNKDLPYVLADQRVIDLAASIAALSAKLGDLRNDSLVALKTANEKIKQAEVARQDGDRRYAEARAALQRYNFDRARERVLRSGERYDLSLSIQEDPVLRAERDQKLLALSADISKGEQELVVRDVRRLITEGKQLYFQGEFDAAEESLLRAQSRWKTTNVEDEPEVAYWVSLVRSALSIKTGRTIPVTAPLYAEMSQILNFARQDFERGAALLKARRKTDALAALDAAKSKLRDVKVVFPLNQEAGLLELRIAQLVDPDAFNVSFRRRISDAQLKLKAKPQEAYSELQDLYEINPKFPGLKAIISSVEIDLGLRRPPPDKKALARSVELTAAARTIVDGNVRGQFPVALEQLNEALKLNPDNATAIALKDRIQTDVGGQVSVALTSQDETLYQRAVMELQSGNTIVAQAIVEQLLQNQRNRNAPRILELQKRILARL